MNHKFRMKALVAKRRFVTLYNYDITQDEITDPQEFLWRGDGR